MTFKYLDYFCAQISNNSEILFENQYINFLNLKYLWLNNLIGLV